MLKQVIFAIVALAVIVWIVRWELRMRRTKPHVTQYHEKTDHEKQIELDIATEKGKAHGPNGGGGGV